MNFIKNIIAKPLFKATSLNGISILIKIGIGFITSKIIALFVGPSGMALVGNMRNFLTSTEAFGTLGFENGVVKYVAEHKNNKEQLSATLSTVFVSVAVSCVILALGIFFGADYFNQTILGNFQYSFVFKVLAMALPWYIGNILLVAIINGLGEFKKVIYINIIGNIIGLILSVILIWYFKTEGALLSIVVAPAVLFLVSFVFINQEIALLKSVRFSSFNFSTLTDLSSYSLMALVSSVFGPLVFIAIRHNIIQNIGIEDAGYWEAMSRISSYYFLFITSIIVLYFLPKMAVTKYNSETKTLFWSYYKGIMPIFILGLVVIYFGRDLIIKLVFTKEFLPVSKLFFWQLIGDVFKATSVILGFQFYAKKMTKAFIISELLSLAVLYSTSIYFVSVFQIEGVVIAHAVTYGVYLIGLSIYFRKCLF